MNYLKSFNDLEISQFCDCLDLNLVQTVEKDGIGILLVNNLKDFDYIDKKDLDFIDEFVEMAKPDNILMRFYLKARMIALVQGNNVTKTFTKFFIIPFQTYSILMSFTPFFKSAISVQSFIKEVMKMADYDYTKLFHDVSNGTLTLSEFEQLIRIKEKSFESNIKDKVNGKWKSYFTTLMATYKIDEKLKVQRFKQLEMYMRLNYIVKIAKVLIEIKNKNKLTGDFKMLLELASFVI